MTQVILAPQLFDAAAAFDAPEKARLFDFVARFQSDQATPGRSLERVAGARSPNVWSARITDDLRAILYKDGDTWAVVHAGRHDPAYQWAECREIGRHSVTGSLQIVETVETVREVERIIEREVEPAAPPLFEGREDAYLLALGVPESWLPVVREVRSDDELLNIAGKLPPEVAERLVDLAAGQLVTPPPPLPPSRPLVEASDLDRRFYLVEDAEGLSAALEAPLERWISFLHPSQRRIVEGTYSGPAKVSGSAGTGKTVVALHRARHLVRRGERVLITSFVTTLCKNLESNLAKLCSPAESRAITVSTVHREALRIARAAEPDLRPATDDEVRRLLDSSYRRYQPPFDRDFLQAEWENVVRMQGVETWEAYRSAQRTGRGKGLGVRERKVLWQVFSGVLEALKAEGLRDWTGLVSLAEELVTSGRAPSPYTAVIVDEVQDLRPPELRFLRALAADHPGNLMLCGDAGQRIYPGGFSLAALGIEVRGRSTVLRLNYRTTEQIRRLADRLLGDATDDLDGGRESRLGTRSLLRGPEPELRGFPDRAAELDDAAATVSRWIEAGLSSSAVALFARTNSGVKAVAEALDQRGISWHDLAAKTDGPGVRLGTMHRAKGLEFKAVRLIDVSDGVVPSRWVLDRAIDPQDRHAAEERDLRLLYVAMTRARDELVVSWNGQPSPFLEPHLEGHTAAGSEP